MKGSKLLEDELKDMENFRKVLVVAKHSTIVPKFLWFPESLRFDPSKVINPQPKTFVKLLSEMVAQPNRVKMLLHGMTFEPITKSLSNSAFQQLQLCSLYAESIPLLYIAQQQALKTKKVLNKSSLESAKKFVAEKLRNIHLFITPQANNKIVVLEKSVHISSSPFAITANESEIFCLTNDKSIYAQPMHSAYVPRHSRMIPMPFRHSKNATICFARNLLLIFDVDVAFCIDPQTGTSKKFRIPVDIVLPVISDGYYLYSIDYRLKKIYRFEFNGTKAVNIKQIPIIDRAPPTDCMIATDGSAITFCKQEHGTTSFHSYSLYDGMYIGEYTTNELTTFSSWCTLPFSQRHMVLSESMLLLFDNSMTIPFWITGVSEPPPNPTTILDFYSILIFHGYQVFAQSTHDCLQELINLFLIDGKPSGVQLILAILSSIPYQRSIDLYSLATAGTNSLALFSVLNSLSPIINAKLQKNGIISQLVRDSKNLYPVLIFHYMFDFEKLPLTNKASTQLLNFVMENNKFYPDQAYGIVSAFINRVANKRLSVPKFSHAYSPIKTISEALIDYIKLACECMVDGPTFKCSTLYLIAYRMMLLLYEAKPLWTAYSKKFSSLLLIPSRLTPPSVQDVQDYLDMSYKLFLKLLCATPGINPPTFESIESLYSTNQHPLDGFRSDIDEILFNILNHSAGLTSTGHFLKLFNQARTQILHDPEFFLKNIKVDAMNGIICSCLIKYIQSPMSQNLQVSQLRDAFKEYAEGQFTWKFKQSPARFESFLNYLPEFNECHDTLSQSPNAQIFTESILYPAVLHPSFRPFVHKFEFFSEMPIKYIIKYFKEIILFTESNENCMNFFRRNEKQFEAINNNKDVNVMKRIALLHLIALEGKNVEPSDGIAERIMSLVVSGDHDLINTGLELSKYINSTQMFQLCKFCVKLVSIFLYERRNPFSSSFSSLQTIHSLFLLVNFLRNDVSILQPLISDADIPTILALFLVIGDCLSFPLEGTMCHFCVNSEYEVLGIARNFNTGDNTFMVGGDKYSYETISHLYCENLHSVYIEDVKAWEPLFNVELKQPYFMTLKLAALETLARQGAFPVDLEYPTTTMSSVYPCIIEFLQLFGVESTECFSFTNQQLPKGINSKEGTFFSEFSRTQLVTTPLHSDQSFRLEFSVSEQSLLSLCGICDTTGERLETGFMVDSSVTIEYDASSHLITQPKKVAIPPSVHFLFFEIELEPQVIGSYKLDLIESRGSEFMMMSSEFMAIQKNSTAWPYTDSTCFVECQLNRFANILNNQLTLSILIRKNQQISSDGLLNALFLCDPLPFSQEIEFTKLQPSPSWLDLRARIHKFVQSTPIDTSSALNRVIEFFEECTNPVVFTTDSSVCFFSEKQTVTVRDAIIYSTGSNIPLKYIEYQPVTIILSKPSYIIPLNAVTGSFLEMVVHARHLLSFIDNEEVRKLSSVMEGFDERHPELGKILNNLNRIAVALVTENSPESYFFSMSNTCKNKSKFLDPQIAKEFPLWTPSDSHELLIDFHSIDDLEKGWDKTFISTKFSLETGRFLYSLFESLGDKCQLHAYLRHVPGNIGKLRKLIDFNNVVSATFTKEKSKYLSLNHLQSSYTFLESRVRLQKEIGSFTSLLFDSPSRLFHMINHNQNTEEYLLTFFKDALTYTRLVFVEYCTDEWGVGPSKKLESMVIHVVFREKPGLIESKPSERLLVLGTFESLDEFKTALIHRLIAFKQQISCK